MRLTSRYLAYIPAFTLTVCDSNYIGTKAQAIPLGMIKGRISPVSDKLSYELYGERIASMRQLTTTDTLGVGIVCEMDNALYRVISSNRYTTHTIAILEWQSDLP